MAYEKQNFEDGMTLFAEQLNHMEAGIAQNASDLTWVQSNYQPKGDYLTEVDTAEIVNAVLAALPTWNGGSY